MDYLKDLGFKVNKNFFHAKSVEDIIVYWEKWKRYAPREDYLIDGVVIKRLNRIPDERGCIYHMLKEEDKEFNRFGEIYFSSVYPCVIKGWHIHKKMELTTI